VSGDIPSIGDGRLLNNESGQLRLSHASFIPKDEEANADEIALLHPDGLVSFMELPRQSRTP